jgi:23S rRNA (cytosine1962-C5)-methyltransferase
MGDLANRIGKNLKHLRRWANREQVDCFRIYDYDIPEVPLRVDLYRGHLLQGGEERLCALAYANALRESDDLDAWKSDIALSTGADSVLLKERGRRAGGTPLLAGTDLRGGEPEDALDLIVEEGGLKFGVRLSGPHDTGLFLDHRKTRAWVRERAARVRVLNLFCYTGSFSIYAVDGKAEQVTSVDLSHTALDWLEKNIGLNGQPKLRHKLVQADVLPWLQAQTSPYDLIVCDPPTFSNSKRMEREFEVQRDHVALISACRGLLSESGQLLFSVNDRGFKLDKVLSEDLIEVSEDTRSEDCQRRLAHRCWSAGPPGSTQDNRAARMGSRAAEQRPSPPRK